MGKRSRRKPSAANPRPPSGVPGTSTGTATKSDARNEAVRRALEPLPQGERPGAVTVAAVVAFVMAIANVVAALLGESLGGDATSSTALSTVILLACAGGMWFGARYWAVMGFMVVLVFQILVFSLALIRVERWWVAILLVVAVGLLGWLFYRLIRALARIQMPERSAPPPR